MRHTTMVTPRIFLAISLAFGLLGAEGWVFRRGSTVTYDKITLETNESFMMANASIDHTAKLFSLYATLLVNLHDPVHLQVTMYHLEKGHYVKSPFLNFDVNMCVFARVVGSVGFLAKSIYDAARPFGVLPGKCPIKQNVYYLRRYNGGVFTFPNILPSNKFRLDAVMKNAVTGRGKDVFKASFYFHFGNVD